MLTRLLVAVTVLLGLSGCSGSTDKEEPFSDLLIRADSQWSRGDQDLAIQTLESMLVEDPDNFFAHYRLGILLSEENADAALDHFSRAEERRPKHPGPVYMSGMLRLGFIQDREAAEEDLRRGFELALDREGLLWPAKAGAAPRGLTELRRNRFAAAAESLALATEDQKSHAAYWFLYATALLRSNSFTPGQEALNRALELRPDYAEALALKGEFLRAQADYAGAKAALEHALTLNPEAGGAHFQMGLLLIQESELRRALQSFWWSLLDNPTLPDAHQFVSNAFGQMDMSVSAQPHLIRLEKVSAFRRRYLELPGSAPR